MHHMMRNARFGPLTLLMTLRVINVKSDDKGRVTVWYYKWPTFTVKNRLRRNPSKILPNHT